MRADFTDNRTLKRFKLAVAGEVVAWLDYELAQGVIALNHTEVLPVFRGRGLAGDIAAFALLHVQVKGLRVLPTCSFVATYIKRNPEYRDLVA